MKTKELLKKYLKELETDVLRTRSGAIMKPSTKRSYVFAIYKYLAFGEFEITKFGEKMTPEQRMKLVNDFNKHIIAFSESIEGYRSINSMVNIINVVGIVLTHIANEIMVVIPKIKRPNRVQQPIMTLSADFVKKFLTDEEMYNSFSDKNKMMWEVCAIMLVTSLRVNDAVKLTEMDFDENKDGLFMLKQNEKTGTITTAPLPSFLSKVIKNNLSKGRLYTKCGMLRTADNIRRSSPDLFVLYEETHCDVVVRKYDNERKIISTTVKLYKAIHPHILRKTAITLMLANGVSPEHVKFSSGHTQNSRSFERYIGFTESRFNSQIKNYYDRVL